MPAEFRVARDVAVTGWTLDGRCRRFLDENRLFLQGASALPAELLA
jgi:hypothetical protein